MGSRPPARDLWTDIAYGNGRFAVIAHSSKRAASSSDGFTWEMSPMPSCAYWQAIAYDRKRFVAVACHSDKAAIGVFPPLTSNAADAEGDPGR